MGELKCICKIKIVSSAHRIFVFYEISFVNPLRNRNRPTGPREPENRRRFQSGGGGGGDIPPPRRERPIQSQGRPLPPQDFNFPDGARPLDPLDRPLDG